MICGLCGNAGKGPLCGICSELYLISSLEMVDIFFMLRAFPFPKRAF